MRKGGRRVFTIHGVRVEYLRAPSPPILQVLAAVVLEPLPDGLLDVTGPIGDQGLAYRFIGYGVSEDYWRNFGRHREMLVAPSLAWYGKDTTVQLNYEHREFIYPFDRGTAFINGAPLALVTTPSSSKVTFNSPRNLP